MKKFAAIPLIFMILFSGISINIASHYCGGNYKGSEVSFSGKLASCGMEAMPVSHSSQEVLKRHCCENIVSSLTLSGTYVPVSFSQVTAPSMESFQIYAVPQHLFTLHHSATCSSEDVIRPPGSFCPVIVEQQVICVFRI